MLLEDHRKEYLSRISLDKSKVVLSPAIILFFGGEISKDPTRSSQSIRHILYNELLCNHSSFFKKLVIPEDFTDWLNDSIYPDLFSFEKDLAQTSSFIIIVLESAGSISELSSLSMHASIRDKLIVIISETHNQEVSFITHGILRLIPTENIYVYDFSSPTIPEKIINETPHIINALKELPSRLNKEENFDSQNNGHIAFLIFELILFFQALTITEIMSSLSVLSPSLNSDKKSVTSLLFLLRKLDLIGNKTKGHSTFYFTKTTDERINFSSKNPKNPFNRMNIKMEINTKLFQDTTTKEKSRQAVIKGLPCP